MKDDISKIDQRILQLKQKKEKIKTQQALLLFKEAQIIIGEQFSCDLVLNILSSSWDSSSPQQKEEWINSAHSFRTTNQSESSSTRKSKKASRPTETDSQNPKTNPQS